MKKLSFTTTKAIVISLFCFLIFVSAKVASDKSQATVEAREGIKLFILSNPVSEYVKVGDVKVSGLVSSAKAPHMMECLVKEVKKKFPTADGLIVYDLTFEKGEAIMFK